MLDVLVVEDDTTKFGKIHNALVSGGVESARICHAVTASQALERLESGSRYDLLLLDVNLPRRLGESAQRGGGLEVLRELGRGDHLARPRYVVGVTAFEELVSEFGPAFEDELWSLIHYSENSDRWRSQLAAKLKYLVAAKRSERFSDGRTYGTDLAIVCALEQVEFDAVQRLPCDWEPLRLPHDETRYLSGALNGSGGPFSLLAAAAPRMGMPATAVLASKIINQFRPRFLAMVGICAGRFEKVLIGDIIVADPSWDWGSGKIKSEGDQPKFLPAPHHLDLDVDVASRLKELAGDKALLSQIKAAYPGPKPNSEITVHPGPLASGAAVVAHKPTFDALVEQQHRNLLGIDMEAYGLVAAARASGRPRPLSLVIKAVSDYADADKSDDFQAYAAHNSAQFLFHAVQRLMDL